MGDEPAREGPAGEGPAGEGPGDELRPRRRRTQAEARAETRRRLLAAAGRVFAEKGFAGASLEEISELAGYTTGALYYHFANKDQLFLELIREGWSRRSSSWAAAAVKAVEEGVEDAFALLSSWVAKRAERDDALGPLQGEIWLYALRHPEAMSMVAEQLREQVAGLRPPIARLMGRVGTAPGISDEEMTTVVLALFQGLVRRRSIDPSSVSDDLFARVLTRLLVTGSRLNATAPGAE